MYRLEVQLTPQIHNGSMKYYWHIFLVDGSNQIDVCHGWHSHFGSALLDAKLAKQAMGI